MGENAGRFFTQEGFYTNEERNCYNQSDHRGRDLETTFIVLFPHCSGNIFQQLYNTADTIVVGRFVSKEALAAVGGSAAQIVGLIVGFFVGLASGASVIIPSFTVQRTECS